MNRKPSIWWFPVFLGKRCFMKSTFLFLICTMILPGLLFAQEKEKEKTADEIAQELSNPVGALASLIVQGNYVKWGGSAPDIGNQNTSTITFLPTIPVPLKKGNLIIRPVIPFSSGLNFENNEWEKETGLGDIGLIAMYGYNFESGIVLGGGMNVLFPTASKPSIGSDQYQLGPAAVFAFIRKWGVLGGLWQHYFGVGDLDEGTDRVNLGTFQAFYWFGVGNGWQIGGSPTMTANYVGGIDTSYSIPVNLGIAKTVILGRMPLKLTVQGQYFLTRPDVAGASWGVFFQVTPVVKLPW